MKCLDCGAELEIRTENHRYDECGLPYVVLEAVEVHRCPKCGETEVTIPAIEKLHRLIALRVAHKPSLLTPEEVRFLRKFVGFSTGDFARVMGVAPETVSRWENGVRPHSPLADRLVRLLVVTREPASGYPIEDLVRIDVTRAEPIRLEASHAANKTWEAVAS